MTILPAVLPPLPREKRWDRNLRPAMAWRWLAAGWRDLRTDPLPSLAYGFLIFLLSVAIIGGLFAFGWDYILFPALAGFMVVGPILAVGNSIIETPIRSFALPPGLNDSTLA